MYWEGIFFFFFLSRVHHTSPDSPLCAFFLFHAMIEMIDHPREIISGEREVACRSFFSPCRNGDSGSSDTICLSAPFSAVHAVRRGDPPSGELPSFDDGIHVSFGAWREGKEEYKIYVAEGFVNDLSLSRSR